ncbi:dimethylarginine dimethylaminohydrolase family protein [Natronorarus salvus]|uniref:dimethylarginine dimethylaminohydrolase family protein n=1 Tax=Natronorarus salvus TaxID=3117733 RepID=UPI002F2627E3
MPSSPTVPVVEAVSDLSFSTGDLPARPDHATLALARPTHFDVRYHINPYMREGVDTDRAHGQWETLLQACERYAENTLVIDPDVLSVPEGTPDPATLPDFAFGANHALPIPDGTGALLAAMSTDERVAEPTYFEAWAHEAGYDVLSPPDHAFEGGGDALWHPGRRLLWGGHGIRSERAAYDDIADRLDTRVIALELTDPHYYHLDVCFSPLDSETVLIQPEAFTDEGLALIEAVFDRLLAAPVSETRGGLACNAVALGDRVLLGAGNPTTERLLSDAGFDPVPIGTDEFQKAGGSVRCLTLSLGDPEAGDESR